MEHRAAGAIVANGHYYGGRFVCAENARITEPGLHVCLFQKPGRWQENAEILNTGLISTDQFERIRNIWNKNSKPEWVGQV